MFGFRPAFLATSEEQKERMRKIHKKHKRLEIKKMLEENKYNEDDISADEDVGEEETIDSLAADIIRLKEEKKLREERIREEKKLRESTIEKQPEINVVQRFASNFCTGKCMMKECKKPGQFGLNLKKIQAFIKAMIPVLAPYIHKKECCCFCIGHFVFMMTMIGSNIIMDKCSMIVKSDEMDKLQKLANSINDIGVEETYKKRLAAQSNKILTKGIIKSMISPRKMFLNLINPIQEAFPDSREMKNLLLQIYTIMENSIMSCAVTPKF